MCYFGTSAFFFSSGRGSFLVLSATWHAGSPPAHHAQLWALAEVRGTCSGGFKVASPLGEGFRARRAIQLHANSRTGKKNVRRLMWYLGSWVSSMSSDFTYFAMEKFFSRHQRARHAITVSTVRWRICFFSRIWPLDGWAFFTCARHLYEYYYVQGK